ncbi:MAG: hypothetical protein NTZ59_01300 [Bacteroidetes bacterium]|nr:hypothetical protein [Bacteroidota bacterium]
MVLMKSDTNRNRIYKLIGFSKGCTRLIHGFATKVERRIVGFATKDDSFYVGASELPDGIIYAFAYRLFEGLPLVLYKTKRRNIVAKKEPT